MFEFLHAFVRVSVLKKDFTKVLNDLKKIEEAAKKLESAANITIGAKSTSFKSEAKGAERLGAAREDWAKKLAKIEREVAAAARKTERERLRATRERAAADRKAASESARAERARLKTLRDIERFSASLEASRRRASERTEKAAARTAAILRRDEERRERAARRAARIADLSIKAQQRALRRFELSQSGRTLNLDIKGQKTVEDAVVRLTNKLRTLVGDSHKFKLELINAQAEIRAISAVERARVAADRKAESALNSRQRRLLKLTKDVSRQTGFLLAKDANKIESTLATRLRRLTKLKGQDFELELINTKAEIARLLKVGKAAVGIEQTIYREATKARNKAASDERKRQKFIAQQAEARLSALNSITFALQRIAFIPQAFQNLGAVFQATLGFRKLLIAMNVLKPAAGAISAIFGGIAGTLTLIIPLIGGMVNIVTGLARAMLRLASTTVATTFKLLLSPTIALVNAMQRLAYYLPLVAAGLAAFVSQKVIDQALEFARAVNLLNLAFSGRGAEQFEKLRKISDRLGISFQGSITSFAELAFAAREAGISLADTEAVFKGVATASAALQLDAQRVESVFFALGQTFSKGKLQAEELRRQLANAFPGIVPIVARALGKTTAQLDIALRKGEITAKRLGEVLGPELQRTFALAAFARGFGLAAQVNRLETQFGLLQKNLATRTAPAIVKFKQALVSILTSKPVLKFLEDVADRFALLLNFVRGSQAFNQSLKTLAVLFRQLIGPVSDLVQKLGSLMVILNGVVIAGIVGLVQKYLPKLNDLLDSILGKIRALTGIRVDNLTDSITAISFIARESEKVFQILEKLALRTFFKLGNEVAKLGLRISNALKSIDLVAVSALFGALGLRIGIAIADGIIKSGLRFVRGIILPAAERFLPEWANNFLKSVSDTTDTALDQILRLPREASQLAIVQSAKSIGNSIARGFQESVDEIEFFTKKVDEADAEVNKLLKTLGKKVDLKIFAAQTLDSLRRTALEFGGILQKQFNFVSKKFLESNVGRFLKNLVDIYNLPRATQNIGEEIGEAIKSDIFDAESFFRFLQGGDSTSTQALNETRVQTRVQTEQLNVLQRIERGVGKAIGQGAVNMFDPMLRGAAQ